MECRNRKKNYRYLLGILSENAEFGVFFLKDDRNNRVRLLPPVHELVADLMKMNEFGEKYEAAAVTWAVRKALDKARSVILDQENRNKDWKLAAREKFWEDTPDEFSQALRDWLKKEVFRELSGFSLFFAKSDQCYGCHSAYQLRTGPACS
jgi:L-seryl-tRNA(Ser) seleniumtransferase